MEIIWKYKIDLADEKVFNGIEKERGIVIPLEVKKLIQESNAATPSVYHFMLKTTEKVLGAILSFNEGEEDTDTVFTALNVIEDTKLIPFAIDPFGNYICYDIREGVVVFWEHETGEVSSTEKNMNQFLESLY